MTRLKHVATLVAGGTPAVDEPEMWTDSAEAGFPWVAIADMPKGGVVAETARRVSAAGIRSKRLHIGEPGDILYAMYASVGATATLGIPATWNQAILGITPRPHLADQRFILYWMQHVTPQMLAMVRSNTQDNLNAELVSNAPFSPKPVDEQQRIAEYLDAECDRLDRLIELRRRQVKLIEQRQNSVADEALRRRGCVLDALEIAAMTRPPVGWQLMMLGRTLRQLTNGFVGPTREILVDDGVRYVQGMHIKGGVIDFDRRHFFVTQQWHDDRPRIHLQPADVLIVQTGDIGRIAVVPPDYGEASCHALLIARTWPTLITGPYLGTFLSSTFGYNALLSRATGALHPHLEGSIRSVPVMVPPLNVQGEIVREVADLKTGDQKALKLLTRSMVLLRERKQALITAAVTGEFDVSAASGRGA